VSEVKPTTRSKRFLLKKLGKVVLALITLWVIFHAGLFVVVSYLELAVNPNAPYITQVVYDATFQGAVIITLGWLFIALVTSYLEIKVDQRLRVARWTTTEYPSSVEEAGQS
jgi:predicted membrane protein